jgi:chitinase
MIKTDGLTHLYWAFAEIDPNSFAVVPSDSRDLDLYADFTGLAKTKNLQTWISIGGFDYTTADATHTTFSDMVNTAANRQKFINSAVSFMQQHGFTGIDIDWVSI